MTNQAFFEQHAKPGTIALIGGSDLVDRTIQKAQKLITQTGQNSFFSHAFIVGEKRSDDQLWIIESDIVVNRKQVNMGVQENRLSKYYEDEAYPNVALLDFNLSSKQVKTVIAEALCLVADRANYSINEVLGVLIAFTSNRLRQRKNLMANDKSFFCSAMVQHCYSTINFLFQEEVSSKHLTPEEIYRTPLAHQVHEIIRLK